ncbi:uromodulin-like isoform X2 [Macrobrachium rosenbergii]|uniref:uromodulin-like isoform X2 n=1 Tax=Macrobrachium rosenbergii TaxID=79674 RepID=UPI0034D517B4
MNPAIIAVIIFLAGLNFAYCQDHKDVLISEVRQVNMTLRTVLDTLKEMQEKLDHVENSLQGQLELASTFQQEISGVMSFLKAVGIDECSEGSHNCGRQAICTDTLFSFACSCPPGFGWDGPHCVDIDECAQGKAECSPHATCRNSVGSYRCSCNPPYEGDGRTCEFSCKSPAQVIEGLGCLKYVKEEKTWAQMKSTCQEAGGRLLQDFQLRHLQEIDEAFLVYIPWVGVHGGKWTETGAPIKQDLWKEGHHTSPSWRCGYITWDSSSSEYKVTQIDCSYEYRGLCQFLM